MIEYCCEKSKKYIFMGYKGYPAMICDYKGETTGDFCDDPEDVYIDFCPFCGKKLLTE